MVWRQVVPPQGYAQVRCIVTRASLEPRRLESCEAGSLASSRHRHSGFAMRAVPVRAAESGYADVSDYEELTRKQRGEATRFTHSFDVVAVTTQPKGTGSLQLGEWYDPSPVSDGWKERVRQVGSLGRTAPRRAAGGDRTETVTRPFDRVALHARPTERSRKAKAGNELAMQRQRGYGSGTWGGGDADAGSEPFSQMTANSTKAEDMSSLPEAEDVQQVLRRWTAVWAIREVGQDPSDKFNGSPAQQLLQKQIESGATEADGLENQGVEGCDLVWWFNSWQHWQQDKDRKLSGFTDFDAMYFARTQRIRLGGAWGCVLARMRETQTTAYDTQLVDMMQATFRLASTVCERKTPGVILFAGMDAQQMSDSSSRSGAGTESGRRGDAGGQAESATGEQPAPGEEATAEQLGSGDNTSVVMRAMNNVELRLAKSQASIIMHKLMGKLTALVTNSLDGDNGTERNTMMAAASEEHHHMLITVRNQAAEHAREHARAEFQKISSMFPQGAEFKAAQPGEEQRTESASLVSAGVGGQHPGHDQQAECGTPNTTSTERAEAAVSPHAHLVVYHVDFHGATSHMGIHVVNHGRKTTW